ncbi:MAG: 50S ribosomal protein L3, partial [Candidatus Thermoplasmatota archaeon]|nr:50S ribosomal protein L3 [Candidatus Thermoplasmatota archaeon]
MPKKHHPKRGSHGFSPRKRAAHTLARFSAWPDDGPEPVVQGFSGFKAGMTHVMMVDYRPASTTAGQEVREAVTVLEVPPLGVAGVRA